MMLASEETADDDVSYVLRWIQRPGRPRYLLDVRNPICEPRKPDFLV